IFLTRVLRIVEEQIDPLGQVEAGRPLGVDGKASAPERRLVVGEIRERAMFRLDPVAHRRPRMADARGPDVELSDGEAPAARVVQLEVTWQGAQPHGKQGRGEVSAEARLKAQRGAGRSPDVDLHFWVVERTEEPQSDDVVHVEVGEQYVDSGEPRRQLERE